jgi:hypothetical protein
LFTMQFFYSLPRDGSFLSMECHPMEGHSGEPQVGGRLTTRKKVDIEGNMRPFYEDCEGDS